MKNCRYTPPKYIRIGKKRKGKEHGKWITIIMLDGNYPFSISAKGKHYMNGINDKELPASGITARDLFGQIDFYETQYRHGEQHGKEIYWDSNGQKKMEKKWLNDKKHGTFIKWDNNGCKIVQGKYRNGKKHGLERVWYGNGKKKKAVEYRDGIEIIRKEWDEEGNQIK